MHCHTLNSRVLPCTLLTLRVCAEVQLRVFESFFEPECGVSEGTAVEGDPSTGPDGSGGACLSSTDHQSPWQDQGEQNQSFQCGRS